MSFSRMMAAKAKAKAPGPGSVQDAEAEAWQRMLAKEREEQAASEAKARPVAQTPQASAVAKAMAAADERRMAEAQQSFQADQESYNKAQSNQQLDAEQQRLARIERSKAEAAKRATASGGGFGGFGAAPAPKAAGFSWKKPNTGSPAVAKAGGYASKGMPTSIASADLPGHDDCELAISAMISRTVQGMREGFRQLGLPDFPLKFIPGKELHLCGHDVREVVNEMIHAWMTEEKDEFYNVLLRIKSIVSKPILTEDEVAMIDQKDAWQKLVTEQGEARYVESTGGKPGIGPPAKPKPVASTGAAPSADDDSEDEVIDLANPKPSETLPSKTYNFAKPAASSASTAPPLPCDTEDYYGLLGVAPTAGLQEIRLKFRSLVVTAHPEKGGDPKTFAKLNTAYSVLSDSEKRGEYDARRQISAD